MSEKKTLAILGLGAFGQLMVKHLSPYVTIVASDPAPQAAAFAAEHNIPVASLKETVKQADVVVLAVPVPKMEEVLIEIKDSVKPGALVMDVGSVKVYPSQWMDKHLPPSVDVICTHPLFGPLGAAKNGTKGLKVVLCPLRGPKVQERATKITSFLSEHFGIETMESTPDEHDRELAYVQGLPHLISQVLINMEPLPRRMMTPNYNLFLQSIDIVRLDTEDLFLAIMRDNPYCRPVREAFFAEAHKLKQFIEAQGG